MTDKNNVNIYFPGIDGFNGTSTCPSGKTCWANFGAGRAHKINLRDYYECTFQDRNNPTSTEIQECESGKKDFAKGGVLEQLQQNGYTGVTFDYENDDANPPLLAEWRGYNKYFQDNQIRTGLTMGRNGLGTGLNFGYPSTQDKAADIPKAQASATADGSITNGAFLAYAVPFDYIIPQVYGGTTLFYTGEYNHLWDGPPEWNSACYFDACLKVKDKNECSGDPTNADNPIYCSKPMELLCQDLPQEKRKMVPSFGGSYPTGGIAGVKKLCPQWDGTSFISWNINNPDATGVAPPRNGISPSSCPGTPY